MEKVANSPPTWCGIVLEIRCRAPKMSAPGGVPEEIRVCAAGFAAHASRTNGGRWLLPHQFVDLVGMWVPLMGP